MFSDKSYSPVSIPSFWESSKSSEETGTQTADIVGIDKDEQTSYTRSIEVQTDNPEQVVTTAVVDEKALATFLKNICPKVLEELDKASKSKAFLSYQLPDEDVSQEIRSIHHLVKPKNKTEDNLKVNSLTWSCTGGVVVLGLGSKSHDDWCSHTGFVHFYNINRNTSMSMTPSKVLEATSCVTSVATHPYEPSILASGLYRGNIVLWNLQVEGAECIGSVSCNNEPISQISWISGSIGRLQLISGGLDGQMNLWNVSHIYDSVTLKESYALSETTETALEAGVTCFSFSNIRPDVFVAALEGGKILHCCLNTSKSGTKVGFSTPLKNPVVGNLEGHKGLITCLAFSPYHEDLFLSVGTDHEIHVNSLFEVAPMKIIWSETEVLGVAWSPSQANIFMSWGQCSEIIVYDCKTAYKLSSVKTDLPTMCALALNWKSPKLIAVGDTNGKGYVWQVPQYFKTG